MDAYFKAKEKRMSDASKDEIILCGCGWTGTREDWHTHSRMDSRHATCQRCAELEAAQKRISELERENARLGLTAGNECREHTANENQLKADLEAAERLLPTIKHDEEFVWLVIQNGLINLCALSPITSMRFLEWAGKVDAYFQAKEKR